VQAEIGNYIGQLLTMKLESILKKSSDSLQIDTEIETLFRKWNEIVEYNTPFFYSNARFLFFKGVEKMPNIGALASSSLIVKNINPITTPNNILSPFVITIGITTARDIGSPTYRGVDEKWKEKLTKKIIDTTQTQNLWEKIEKMITDFWVNTEKALIQGTEILHNSTDSSLFSARYVKYDSEYQNRVSNIESSSIKNIIDTLRN
jgi:hypothetical protein